MSVTIRRAQSADVDALYGLEKVLFLNDAWSRELFVDELDHPFSYYLVAEGDAEIVGYAGLRAAPAEAEQGDIQTLAVVPEHRGHGLGRKLLGQLMDEAQSRGVKALFLEVRADNPVALALYRSVGFHEIDRRHGYYQPDGVDAVVMVRAEGMDVEGGATT
jgi:ribosomal-protein-alanine N-acetyltransferase